MEITDGEGRVGVGEAGGRGAGTPRSWLAVVLILVASVVVVVGNAGPAGATQLGYCDFNGDGRDDLAIGAPNADERARNDGRVDVWFGTDLSPLTLHYFNHTIRFNEPQNGAKLGQSMLCVDLDADGYEDLILGSPFHDVFGVDRSGVVNIHFGGPDGFDGRVQTVNQAVPGVKGPLTRKALFGWELSAGDFNADGVFDLVVSAPGAPVRGVANAGKVHILYGRRGVGIVDAGGRVGRHDVIHQAKRGIADAPDANDFYGLVLTSADFNGDGHQDLAIGVPLEDVGPHPDAGAINVIYGDGNGLSRRDQFLHRDKSIIRGSAQTAEYFGYVMRTEQVIGRDRNRCFSEACRFELVVGVPGQDIKGKRNAGAIHILRGTNNGLNGRRGEVWHRGTRGIRDRLGSGDEFGYAIAFGFFNDDGLIDIAVGVPGDDKGGRRNSGSVQFIFGDGNGLSRADKIIHHSQPGFDGQGKTSDRMGMTFAAGDFDGDSWSDLAIGVPLRDVGGREDAGMVLVVRGRTGLDGDQSVSFNASILQSCCGHRARTNENYGNFSFPLITGFGGFQATSLLLDPAGSDDGAGSGGAGVSSSEQRGELLASSGDS